MPSPDAVLPREPKIKADIENLEWVKAVQDSDNQLSRDYQDAWDRHLKRLERMGVK